MSNLNPGIVRTVEWLNAHGFKTIDSGDGETHDYECDRPYPYVVMITSPDKLVDEAERLYSLLSSEGFLLAPFGCESDACIQASYDPADGTAVIELINLADKDWQATQANTLSDHGD